MPKVAEFQYTNPLSVDPLQGFKDCLSEFSRRRDSCPTDPFASPLVSPEVSDSSTNSRLHNSEPLSPRSHSLTAQVRVNQVFALQEGPAANSRRPKVYKVKCDEIRGWSLVLEDNVSLLDPACQFVAVKKDGRLGLRSGLAQGRLLRCNPQLELGFVRGNLESWEAWSVRGESLADCTLRNRRFKLEFNVTVVTIGEVIDSPGNVRLTHDAVLAAEALAYPGPFVSSSAKKSATRGRNTAEAPSTVSQRVSYFDALQGGGSAGKGASRSRSVGALSRDLGREMDAVKGSSRGDVGRSLDGGDRRQMNGAGGEMDGADEKRSRGRPRGTPSIDGGNSGAQDGEDCEIDGGVEARGTDDVDEEFGTVGGDENGFSGVVSEAGRSGREVRRGDAGIGGQKEHAVVTKRRKSRWKEEGLKSNSVAAPNGLLEGGRDPNGSVMVLSDAAALEPEADVLVKNALVMEPQRREVGKVERRNADGFARTESGSDGLNVRRKAGAVAESLGGEDEVESRRGPDVGADAEELRHLEEENQRLRQALASEVESAALQRSDLLRQLEAERQRVEQLELELHEASSVRSTPPSARRRLTFQEGRKAAPTVAERVEGELADAVARLNAASEIRLSSAGRSSPSTGPGAGVLQGLRTWARAILGTSRFVLPWLIAFAFGIWIARMSARRRKLLRAV